MKKQIAIPIIAILAVLVVALGSLYINALSRFSKGSVSVGSTASADAISGASMFLSSSDYSLENATDVFSLPNTAVVISTVNADGTPNAATMETMIIDNETFAIMSSLGNQTMLNISSRQYAVFTVYSVDFNGGMGEGARLVVECITDNNEKQQKKDAFKATSGRDLNDNAILLKVIRVLPLT